MKVYLPKILIFVLFCIINLKLDAKEFKIISLQDFPGIEKIKFQDESDQQVLSIKKYYPNANFTVPKSELIHFYGIHNDTKVSSKKPILRLSFENIEDDSIIFLTLDEDQNGKINHEIFINDQTNFPPLSTLIMNLSDNKVVAKIGNEIIKILPNSRTLFNFPSNERGSFSDKVVFAARKGPHIDYFHSTFWRVPKGKKTICIIEYNLEQNIHILSQILL